MSSELELEDNLPICSNRSVIDDDDEEEKSLEVDELGLNITNRVRFHSISISINIFSSAVVNFFCVSHHPTPKPHIFTCFFSHVQKKAVFFVKII